MTGLRGQRLLFPRMTGSQSVLVRAFPNESQTTSVTAMLHSFNVERSGSPAGCSTSLFTTHGKHGHAMHIPTAPTIRSRTPPATCAQAHRNTPPLKAVPPVAASTPSADSTFNRTPAFSRREKGRHSPPWNPSVCPTGRHCQAAARNCQVCPSMHLSSGNTNPSVRHHVTATRAYVLRQGSKEDITSVQPERGLIRWETNTWSPLSSCS
jgi:hypothetical protein